MKSVFRYLRRVAKRVDRFFHRIFSTNANPLENPLFGDRAIEYAFVISQLKDLDRNSSILDIGSSGSPLTTIIKSLGFVSVDAIDLLPSPLEYNGIRFIQGDFLDTQEINRAYDVIIFCSSIEHIGLHGRFGSSEKIEGDLDALQRAYELLKPGGLLLLTIPYGVERVIRPYHRVYNKQSRLLAYAFSQFEVIAEEYYRNNAMNVWTKCSETEARHVLPSMENFALGLFAFRKKGSTS